MSVDKILCEIGEFGKYQKLVIFFVIGPCIWSGSIFMFNQLFMFSSPPNCCYSETNNSYQLAENRSMCASGFESEHVHKWHNNHEEEYFICESEFLISIPLMLMGVGCTLGSTGSTFLENRIGRKISFFVVLLIAILLGLGTTFAVNFWSWTAIRFLLSLTLPVLQLVPYTLALEMVGPKHRIDISVFYAIAANTAAILLSIIASVFRNWHSLTWATTAPFILLFLFWRILTESPRWYLAHGKFDDAVKILHIISKVNGHELTEEQIMKLKEDSLLQTNVPHKEDEDFPQYTIKDLFVRKSLRKVTCLSATMGFTTYGVNTGLFYYAHVLGGDRYLNFALSGIVRLIGPIIVWPFMERTGRRGLICGSMIVVGVACVITPIVEHEDLAVLSLFCIGAASISVTATLVVLFIAELYPTPVRVTGLYVFGFTGQIGMTLIPIVNYLGVGSHAPLVVFGCLSIIGSFSCFLLRETKDKNLQEYVFEDGETKV